MAKEVRTKRIDLGKALMLREVKNADGLTVIAGIFPGSGAAEGKGDLHDDGRTTVAEIGTIHEFGAPKFNIPRRPWLSQSVRRNQRRWRTFLIDRLGDLLTGRTFGRRIFSELGVDMERSIKRIFTEGSFKALDPETIKAKGSSRPLIDTGILRNSIGWALEDRR